MLNEFDHPSMVHRLIAPSLMSGLRHHDLIAWQCADDLFIRLHKLSLESFPAYERYELGSQIRRAAYSIAANIAEGYGRRHRRMRLHFLNIAEGSLAEVSYCIHVSCRLGYINEKTRDELESALKGVGAPLQGLVRSLRLTSVVSLR